MKVLKFVAPVLVILLSGASAAAFRWLPSGRPDSSRDASAQTLDRSELTECDLERDADGGQHPSEFLGQ